MCNSCSSKGVYNRWCLHCAARFIASLDGDRTLTIDAMCSKYGHDRQRLLEEVRAIEKAR